MKSAEKTPKVALNEWAAWKLPNWQEPPKIKLIAWLKQEVEYRARPYILIDSRGGSSNPDRYVNVKLTKFPGGERRLMVVYVKKQQGLESASWGELLFIDNKCRLPDPHKEYWRSVLLRLRERYFPKRNK